VEIAAEISRERQEYSTMAARLHEWGWDMNDVKAEFDYFWELNDPKNFSMDRLDEQI
jgi:hypothetical protein